MEHTKWNCKYHVVLTPKFRKKMFFEKNKAAIGCILRELCQWKQVTIIQSVYSLPDGEKMRREMALLDRIGDSFKKIIVVADNIKP